MSPIGHGQSWLLHLLSSLRALMYPAENVRCYRYKQRLSLLALLTVPCWCAPLKPPSAQDIVRKSVENTNANWAAAPQFSFTERDIITRGEKRSSKTYEVLMIDGSPYNKLIAVNDQPLSSEEAGNQERNFHQETHRRRKEAPSARARRIAQYRKERRQDHDLMNEMVNAFNFELEGESMVNGQQCFVLDASPRHDYQPKNHETRVLKGMRGRLWIDIEQYQWVKVHAEVFRAVVFGLFIAHVEPGTEFTLEQERVQGNVWLPSHFSTRVRARVLLVSRKTLDDETYSNYHRTTTDNTELKDEQ
jgi:hypothetical protein